jgi:hypothetical protein
MLAGKDRYINVIIEISEVINVPDIFVWNTPTQAEGFKVIIDSLAVPELQFNVTALHPDHEEL